jgi:hypothetical protein
MNSSQTDADTSRPPDSWNPVNDWTSLAGKKIELHERRRLVDRGRVEVTTGDGQILWLAQEGADPRRLWERLPGRSAKVVPEP